MSLQSGIYESWVAVGSTYRAKSRLDNPLFLSEDPSVKAVASAALGARGDSMLLGGCEPTLRRDLPAVVEGVAGVDASRLGLWTDGLALQSRSIVQGLKSLGLDFVRIPFHSGRPDAHDWIAGLPGASRRVVKAIRCCVEAGLEVEVDTILTRPTISLLPETVAVARRLGVSGVHLRVPRCRGDWHDSFVAISPRYGMLESFLGDLRSTPSRPITVRGMPRCVAPKQLTFLGPKSMEWLVPGEGIREDHDLVPGCRTCDDYEDCHGPPLDYISRFGWGEIRSEENQRVKAVAERLPPDAGAIRPPPRAGRAPATRLSFSVNQAVRPTLGGDPLLGIEPRELPDSIRVSFGSPSRIQHPVLGDADRRQEVESTRAIRLRLISAAQQGVRCLRVASAGSLAHPEIGDLLRECRRLSMEEVEVCGEGSALSVLSDREIRRMRGINRFYFALYGPSAEEHDRMVTPGSFNQTLEVGDRIQKLIKAEVNYFAVLTSVAQLGDWNSAWAEGLIPGKPHFRLSPIGDSLSELASALQRCSLEVQDAILPSIPACVRPVGSNVSASMSASLAFGDLPLSERKTSACDIRGTYNRCSTECLSEQRERCPGLAVGWSKV